MTSRAFVAFFAACTFALPLLLAKDPPAPIIDPIFVGARAIKGIASAGADLVTVTIAGTPASAQVDPTTGRFTFEAPDNVQLLAGSTVSVTQTINDKPSPAASVTVAEPLYDWGRVRAYFSTGLMMSKEREDFHKNDLYLGFQVDKNWFQGAVPQVAGANPGNKPARSEPHRGSWYFNSFFDAMLAAVPVQPGAGDNSEDAETTLEPLDQFLASRKAAVLRIGVYIPVVVETWDFEGE